LAFSLFWRRVADRVAGAKRQKELECEKEEKEARELRNLEVCHNPNFFQENDLTVAGGELAKGTRMQREGTQGEV